MFTLPKSCRVVESNLGGLETWVLSPGQATHQQCGFDHGESSSSGGQTSRAVGVEAAAAPRPAPLSLELIRHTVPQAPPRPLKAESAFKNPQLPCMLIMV